MQAAARLPLLRGLLEDAYGRYFDHAEGHIRLFRGIYPNFPAAAQAMPAWRPAGYDNESSAYRVIDEWLSISEYDYPIMFWLSKLVPECRTLFDWGGNVGLKYFAYRKYLPYPQDMRWRVSDLPAVVAVGRTIAEREGATALEFTTTLDGLAEADILLAAGSLNFIEDPIAMLRALPALPRHFIPCKVPVYERPSKVTLHNMGTAVCLYHLFNRDEFVRGVEQLGYRLVDEWKSSDCSCYIPLHAEYSIPAYSGFYFTRDG